MEFAVGIIALYFIFKRQFWVKWLASASAAIVAILFFSVWIIIMATIPQIDTLPNSLPLGLNQVVHTWMFTTASIFLILALGFATLRHSFPLRLQKIPFLINHLGLWIAITTGLLGAVDRKELIMQVYEGQVIWYGQDSNKKVVELPLAIKLEDFVMRTHPPKIAIVNEQGKPYKISGDQLSEITKPTQLKIGEYKINIQKYFPEAITKADSMMNKAGALATIPAAFVEVISSGNKPISGWLTPGTQAIQTRVINISNDTILCLLTPEPAYFGSKVTIYTQSDNGAESKIISVNNPANCEGWTIYQYSYDTQLGNDSPYSVFMLVRDPWLPMVYLGIILMMIGSLWMIFAKVKTKEIEEVRS